MLRLEYYINGLYAIVMCSISELDCLNIDPTHTTGIVWRPILLLLLLVVFHENSIKVETMTIHIVMAFATHHH